MVPLDLSGGQLRSGFRPDPAAAFHRWPLSESGLWLTCLRQHRICDCAGIIAHAWHIVNPNLMSQGQVWYTGRPGSDRLRAGEGPCAWALVLAALEGVPSGRGNSTQSDIKSLAALAAGLGFGVVDGSGGSDRCAGLAPTSGWAVHGQRSPGASRAGRPSCGGPEPGGTGRRGADRRCHLCSGRWRTNAESL